MTFVDGAGVVEMAQRHQMAFITVWKDVFSAAVQRCQLKSAAISMKFLVYFPNKLFAVWSSQQCHISEHDGKTPRVWRSDKLLCVAGCTWLQKFLRAAFLHILYAIIS